MQGIAGNALVFHGKFFEFGVESHGGIDCWTYSIKYPSIRRIGKIGDSLSASGDGRHKKS
jgi:hypothetical protein